MKQIHCIFVVNSGSSSLKFGLFDIESAKIICKGLIDWAASKKQVELRLRSNAYPETAVHVNTRNHGDAVSKAIRSMKQWSLTNLQATANIVAVGHRVVHGGTLFRESTLIDESVRSGIDQLSSLAPLHNPAALQAILASQQALPEVKQVAVFDTAFFSSLAPQAFLYPVPYEWYSHWGIRRFGFHGINHSYCANRAAEMLGKPLGELRLITCHLGNGCSAAAIAKGNAIATTMGYTPIDGMMMGTRPGSLDPGILIDVQRRGLGLDELDKLLNHGCGLLGVSGISSDIRQLEAAAQTGNQRAGLALAMFCDRVRSQIGALAVTLGGVDALIFTAGIGENSATQRTTICDGLKCLGLDLDVHRNAMARPDCNIAADSSVGSILVIESQEDLMIARETAKVTSNR